MFEAEKVRIRLEGQDRLTGHKKITETVLDCLDVNSSVLREKINKLKEDFEDENRNN